MLHRLQGLLDQTVGFAEQFPHAGPVRVAPAAVPERGGFRPEPSGLREGDLAAAEARNRFVLDCAEKRWLPQVSRGGMLERWVGSLEDAR